jgi:predicted TIM-barrel fold metal-dependent hydrolase
MPADAIDLHAHYLPPSYRAALERAGLSALDGNAVPPPPWSVSAHLGFADATGIATSVLSISSPGLLLTEDVGSAAELARRVNEEGAAIVRDRPERFGLFASLPLPDVDASLGELERALDELGADGVSLLTNYAGRYLGSTEFEPLLAELSRREVVVALHPTSPPGWEAVAFGRTRGMIEFMFDTARTVVDLILSGGLERHHGLKLIVPHTGGVIPLLADRVDRSRLFGESSRVDVLAALRGLHYDLSGEALPRGLPALLALVDPDRLVYGSDYPFHREDLARTAAENLSGTDLLSEDEARSAFRDTALGLLPRLRASPAATSAP